MCDQCVTNMLSVYHSDLPGKEDMYQSFYIGIARESYIDDYEPGDIMIGRVNDPDMIIRQELFSREMWEKAQEIGEDTEKEKKRTEALGEDYSYTDLDQSPLPSDRFVYGEDEGNIFNTSFHQWWKLVPRVVKQFEEAFGPAPEIFSSMWTAYVVAETYRVFEESGIPKTPEGRKEWAQKFPDDIDSVELKNIEVGYDESISRTFHMRGYGSDGGVIEMPWEESEEIPDPFDDIE